MLKKIKSKEKKKGPGPIFRATEGSGLDKSSFGLINQTPKYEKPLFEKTPGMNFTAEIWKKFAGGRFCMQCSACHGCA